MQTVFEQGAHEHRLLGPAAFMRFVLVELSGLVLHAAIAQFANALHNGYLEKRIPFHATLASAEDLPEEVLQAQNRVAVTLNQLSFAISHHQFVQARYYSNEERKARENLRQMREKYGIGDLS
jgi:EAL domain-containing protein (putative c-di-GMP-specific phosphodiesterase class I)